MLRLARDRRLGAARDAARQEGAARLIEIRNDVQRVPRRGEPPDRRAQAIEPTRKSRQAIELGVAGLALLIGPDSPLRLLLVPVDRTAGARGGCRSDPACRGRPFSAVSHRAGPARSASSPPRSTGWPRVSSEPGTSWRSRTRQLRESERLKSDLVNTVSHELRTPLSGVLGFTKLLLTREFDTETRRHYLGIVDAQARRLSQLIDDFLDVRSIEEGRFERARESSSTWECCCSDEATLYSLQSEKHELALDLPETPLPVLGNADRLRQVIGNLLSNAIKYSPQGGRVEVTAGVRRRHDPGRGARRGHRHPCGAAARIFTKFFRADAAASGITGTGLGLAVSRDIVESHGGPDRLHQRRGRGDDLLRRVARWRRYPPMADKEIRPIGLKRGRSNETQC